MDTDAHSDAAGVGEHAPLWPAPGSTRAASLDDVSMRHVRARTAAGPAPAPVPSRLGAAQAQALRTLRTLRETFGDMEEDDSADDEEVITMMQQAFTHLSRRTASQVVYLLGACDAMDKDTVHIAADQLIRAEFAAITPPVEPTYAPAPFVIRCTRYSLVTQRFPPTHVDAATALAQRREVSYVGGPQPVTLLLFQLEQAVLEEALQARPGATTICSKGHFGDFTLDEVTSIFVDAIEDGKAPLLAGLSNLTAWRNSLTWKRNGTLVGIPTPHQDDPTFNRIPSQLKVPTRLGIRTLTIIFGCHTCACRGNHR